MVDETPNAMTTNGRGLVYLTNARQRRLQVNDAAVRFRTAVGSFDAGTGRE